MSDKMREEFEAWLEEDGRFALAKRETIGAMWQAWQAAQRQGEWWSSDNVDLDEPMTEDFKAAWRNGIPLDCMEAKWAFVGWNEAQRQGGEAETLPMPKSRDYAEKMLLVAEKWLQDSGVDVQVVKGSQGGEAVAWMDGDYVTKGPVSNCSSWVPLYTAPQPAVPEGWQLVPITPTQEMRFQFHDSYELHEDGDEVDGCPDDQWRAMLKVAPEPPEDT